jgi:hypothetical protein
MSVNLTLDWLHVLAGVGIIALVVGGVRLLWAVWGLICYTRGMRG